VDHALRSVQLGVDPCERAVVAARHPDRAEADGDVGDLVAETADRLHDLEGLGVDPEDGLVVAVRRPQGALTDCHRDRPPADRHVGDDLAGLRVEGGDGVGGHCDG
jgi:hypothetical protein